MKLHPVTKIELAIVATYIVQKLGQPTLGDIKEQLDKLGVDLDPLIESADNEFVLKHVLDSMKKRDIISQNNKQVGGGHSKTFYSMKKITFATLPEAAHIKDLLPKLIATDAAKEIKRILDNAETEPDDADAENKKSKGRRAKYTDAHIYSAAFITKERLYAGRMLSPSLKELIDESPYEADTSFVLREDGSKKRRTKKDEEMNLDRWFDRTTDGAILIHKCAIRGWFSMSLARITPHGESVGRDHCGFDSVVINPDAHGLKITELPVQPGGFSQGGGVPQKCETIMPGELVTIRFWAPTRGFMQPNEIERYLRFLGEHAGRHLSPGRGTETGKMEMLAFVDHGDTWKDIMMKDKTTADLDAEFEKVIDASGYKRPEPIKRKPKPKSNGGKAAPMFSVPDQPQA